MRELVEKGILFDFYGELLTDHQKEIYSDACFNDLSLSELSETYGISRQGIHDLIRRCDRTLEEYEQKLGLIAKFHLILENTEAMNEIIDRIEKSSSEASILRDCEELKSFTGRILDEI